MGIDAWGWDAPAAPPGRARRRSATSRESSGPPTRPTSPTARSSGSPVWARYRQPASRSRASRCGSSARARRPPASSPSSRTVNLPTHTSASPRLPRVIVAVGARRRSSPSRSPAAGSGRRRAAASASSTAATAATPAVQTGAPARVALDGRWCVASDPRRDRHRPRLRSAGASAATRVRCRTSRTRAHHRRRRASARTRARSPGTGRRSGCPRTAATRCASSRSTTRRRSGSTASAVGEHVGVYLPFEVAPS